MHLRSGTRLSVPTVVSVKSKVMDPKATDASQDAASGNAEGDIKQSEFTPYAGSTPLTRIDVHSHKLGKPARMAANLSFSQDKPPEDVIGQFRELGSSAGLAGRELADFVAERLDKHEERMSRHRREEEERLIKIRREAQEREDRLRKEEIDRADRLKREEEDRAFRMRELDLKMQETQNASLLAADRGDADRERWEAVRQLLSERSSNTARVASDGYRVKLEEWDDKQDIDQFLGHFERIATTHSWPKEIWGVRLVPCLRGAAKEAYLQMDAKDADDYEKLKTTLRQRFRRDLGYYLSLIHI